MRTRFVVPLVALVGALPCAILASRVEAQAQDASAPAPGSRAERLAALRKEYDDARDAHYALFRKAKTDEERKKIAEASKAPDPQRWAPKVWALVDEDPRDDVAFDALQWLVEESRESAEKNRALAAIEEHHVANPKLGDLCDRIGSDPSIPSRLLESIATKSPHRDVKGHATYALAKSRVATIELAKYVRSQTGDADGLKGVTEWLGAERLAEIERMDSASAQAEAEKLLDRVVAEYGDVPFRERTSGAVAKGDLHEMRELAVGKPAPEIEAEDLAGARFKLSDYRGKVVLLDFWGNW